MEGKAVLFKRFADVDSIDLELATEDVERFISAVELLEPSFGGINLEDIKAPECFIIEQTLRERMNIPVLHDDQHGTRSEEHTSELQSLIRSAYAVFCLKKKNSVLSHKTES